MRKKLFYKRIKPRKQLKNKKGCSVLHLIMNKL